MTTQPQLKLAPAPEQSGPMITVPADSFVVLPDRLKELDASGHDIKQGRRWLRMLIADECESERKPIRGPTERPESVTLATEEDEPEVLALILEDTSRQAPKNIVLDPPRILEHIRMGTRQEGGITAVIKSDGKVVAAIVMTSAQPPFSLQFYIHELFNVVHRNHRRSNHARDLVNFAKWCSDQWTHEFGYPVPLFFTVNTSAFGWRKVIWFFRRLMTQVGATFVYPAPPRR